MRQHGVKRMPVSLIDAIRTGQESLARELILGGQYNNVDFQGPRRDGTALYWAACMNNYELAELLLIQGANPDVTTMWNSSPLHAACDNNRTDIARLLLQANCDINCQTDSGDTPCHLAAYRGFSEMVQILVENGASLEKVNKNNRNVFSEATLNASKSELVRYLSAVYKLAGISTTPPSKGPTLPCSLKDFPTVSPALDNWREFPGKNTWLHSICNDLSLTSEVRHGARLSYRNM